MKTRERMRDYQKVMEKKVMGARARSRLALGWEIIQTSVQTGPAWCRLSPRPGAGCGSFQACGLAAKCTWHVAIHFKQNLFDGLTGPESGNGEQDRNKKQAQDGDPGPYNLGGLFSGMKMLRAHHLTTRVERGKNQSSLVSMNHH